VNMKILSIIISFVLCAILTRGKIVFQGYMIAAFTIPFFTPNI